ncbi:MAG TPA: helix-turn-helix transcriptional regulator [Brevundimonas sp.]
MSRNHPVRPERHAGFVAGVVVLQSMAVVFFIADAAGDWATGGLSTHVAIEAFAALGLLAGVAMGLHQLAGLLAADRRKSAALAVAAGALGEVIAAQAREWALTPAETDVAVFALKGCDIAEIARIRKAAPGTVRAQLARVYQKAGVNSRSELGSLFLDELISAPLIGPAVQGSAEQ